MKILFVQPTINPPGGGELVAAWLVEALKDEHELTLLSFDRPRLHDCNRHFGTTLAARDFRVELAWPAAWRVLGRWPLRVQRLKGAMLTRTCLRLAPHYDLVVTANNEMDLGGCGVQYVHFPQPLLFTPGHRLDGQPPPSLSLRLYLAACSRIARDSVERIRTNVTLVNSDWTGRWTERVHPIRTRTVYPPVPTDFPGVPWEDRWDAAIAIGRLSPEKRFERVIDIVSALRDAGNPLRLTIAAFAGDPIYAAKIRSLAARRQEWVTLRENLDNAALNALIPRHRYGIHAMQNEHFGIAVAQMVKAGCITLVAQGGGPEEIVGGEPRLLFSSAADAVERWREILASPALQFQLRSHLAARAPLFSTERFEREIRDVVREAGEARRNSASADIVTQGAHHRSDLDL